MKTDCIKAVDKIDPTDEVWEEVEGFKDWVGSIGRKKRAVHTAFVEKIGNKDILNVWQGIYNERLKIGLNTTPWPQTKAVELGMKKSLELSNITR